MSHERHFDYLLADWVGFRRLFPTPFIAVQIFARDHARKFALGASSPVPCPRSSRRRGFSGLRRRLPPALALFALGAGSVVTLELTTPPLHAAAASSGSISGRVRNQVIGKYLNKARVTVKGTNLVAFTDGDGTFQLVNVPGGSAVLEVFYTDLDPRQVTVLVGAGDNVQQDIDLTSGSRYGTDSQVAKLDPFVITEGRETDAEAIAANEQRFAPNIKNVVATDALGDMFANNTGDFLKYLPGLAADYDNAEVAAISVRGIGGDMTAVTLDGAPYVTGNVGGPTRAVEMRAQALNNISRVDVTKVPTPSSPADALAGTVNLVSKSSFERSAAELHYGLYLVGNGNAFTFRKTPHANGDHKTYKIQPGFDFDYTLPVTKNFGLVVTAMQSNKFNTQNISRKTWNAGGTATGASFSKPFFQQLLIQTSPRSITRTAFSAKADWRVTPNSVISIGGRTGRAILARTGGINLTPSAGNNGAPTPANGVPFSYGPDFTIGATGRGAVTLVGGSQYSYTDTYGGNASYRFDNGRWRIESAIDISGSELFLGPRREKFWANVTAVMAVPVRVTFTDIGAERPGRIEVFDNNNREVDLYDYRNYRMSTATRDLRRNVAASRFANLDVRRRLDWFRVPTSVQIGGLARTQSTDASRQSETWNYTGADAGTGPYLYQVYAHQEAHLGFRNFPGISPTRTWRAYEANPTIFSQTPAQVVAAENFRLNASEFAQETITATYAQGEARLLDNRLNLLTGVRFERTQDKGEGLLFDPNAVFVRNADGSFARNAQGARIRRADAGAVGSLEETRLVRKERGYHATRAYEGYYPSLHVTYNVRENLLTRFAYARTYGRPNFPDIIPNATINEADLGPDQLNDPRVVKGTITVRNTGLKPWTANNYDLSTEYYSEKGGLFSAGIFRKDISNFFGDGVRLATAADLAEIGLDPRYVGWNLATKFNSGDARITGVELNARHSLRPLGPWGQHFAMFANFTRLRLQGNPYASFDSFIPKTANWGVSFNYKRFTLQTKWNYRGLNRLVAQPAFGPDGYQYIKPRTIMDLNVAYQFTRRLAFTGSIGNVFNNNLTQMHYSSETPAYARRSLNGDYGSVITFGIKGTY